jgi:cellulose synthase/poly-beta-1,6-N-acetylglucosamine synthase-like glycosyltransferase
MAEIILIGCLLIVGYVYAGYPMMLWLLAQVSERKTNAAAITPSLSIIIAVHNEEVVISDKLNNTLALDYPPERLEILVASDGSTDGTNEIVAGSQPRGVCLLRLVRCGKMRALEAAVTRAGGEILVFTDANTMIEPQALRAVAAQFADPDVGGVCGRKRIGRAAAGRIVSSGEGFYWKYDQFIKGLESRIGSTIAADGALYAIRRELFQTSNELAQADDIAISTRIAMQGRRLVFEAAAVAWEDPPASVAQEFRRKMRVANHVVRALWDLRGALNPLRAGLLAVQLWSHKLLRYFVPLPLAAAMIANCQLAVQSRFYFLLLAIQCLFYTLALAGWILHHRKTGRIALLHAPFYFCMAHLAALLGVFSAMRGERIVAWNHQRAASCRKAEFRQPG